MWYKQNLEEMNKDLVEKEAKSWISFLDSLQVLGIDEELPVPQIAVFGDQSSGKSSLLESISGIPFPKGTGLVTKCPTRITMSQCNENTPWSAEVQPPAVISESERVGLCERVYSPEELAKLLARTAELLTAKAEGEFSTEIIHVLVESPNTPDLSVIDLPGIIRTTTVGQDRSVIAKVDELLNNFMRQPETVILAVIPANQDIATIDVLERAHKFDSLGVRTIGVMTKPDLVDKGAEKEVLEIVQNVRKPLKLGYVMVKNRSQAELSTKSLQESIQDEEAYFANNDFWSQIDGKCRGVKPLAEKLSQIIVTRAMDRAPFLKWHLLDKLNKIEDKLTDLGVEIPIDEQEKRKMLIKTVSRYAQTLRQISVGDYRDQLAQSHFDLRIRYHVNELLTELKKGLSLNMPDLSSDAYAERLHHGISDMRGRELPGFGYTRLLLATVADELETWRLQVEDTVSQVFNAYTTTANALAVKMVAPLPNLYDAIIDCLHRTCDMQATEMTKRIDEMFVRCTESASTDQDLIDSINNIRFSRFENALKEVLSSATLPEPNSGKNPKEELKNHMQQVLGGFYMHYHSIGYGPNLQLEDARAALKAYWRICEKRINEDVLSAVDMLLLQKCSERVEAQLLSTVQEWLSNPDVLNKMVSEDQAVSDERIRLKEVRSNIRKALDGLDDIIPGCMPRNPYTL